MEAPFRATSEMWYVYFNFYTNNQEEINEFKAELKKRFDFILGFVQYFSPFGVNRVVAYVPSQEEADTIKDGDTLELYQSYTRKNGEIVF